MLDAKRDIIFIAQQLRIAVVEEKYVDSFHVCEAWEVAKKHLPQPPPKHKE